MSDSPFRISALDAQDRSGFSCGVQALDLYFHTRVTQDIRRRVTACYVAEETGTGAIAGFYTLSAADILLADLPEDARRKLPRYPSIPVARLGRLAVDQRFRGRKIGSALLMNAAVRACRSEIAVFALVVDAKDTAAENFYRHHGFRAFGSIPNQLIAPLDTFRAWINASQTGRKAGVSPGETIT